MQSNSNHQRDTDNTTTTTILTRSSQWMQGLSWMRHKGERKHLGRILLLTWWRSYRDPDLPASSFILSDDSVWLIVEGWGRIKEMIVSAGWLWDSIFSVYPFKGSILLTSLATRIPREAVPIRISTNLLLLQDSTSNSLFPDAKLALLPPAIHTIS